MKKNSILLAVLCVLAAAAVVCAVLAPGYFKKHVSGKPDTQTNDSFTLSQSGYTPRLTLAGSPDLPPLQTDIKNLFYTVNPDNGEVRFYEYAAGALLPYGGTVSVTEKTVTCSSQKLPVKLYTVEKDGITAGYGLFTAGDQTTPQVYDYAFFKVAALPPAYGSDGALLLVDFDKNNFWLNDRVYTEAFIIGLQGSGVETKRLTTDNARTVGERGALRSDWLLLTDGFLATLGSKPYFLSSRDYTLDKKGLVADILTLADPKPPRIITGILGLWARVTEKGPAYLRATQTGFDCIVYEDKTETVLKSFSGDYFKDYLSSGNFVLNKTSLVLTDLLSGTEKTLTGVQADKAAFLSVSPDGLRAVIATPGAGDMRAKAQQTLVLYNIATNEAETFTEPLLFSQTNANFCWADNNTLFHLRPINDDGTGLGYCFIKMD